MQAQQLRQAMDALTAQLAAAAMQAATSTAERDTAQAQLQAANSAIADQVE